VTIRTVRRLVLIVDDDDDSRSVLGEALASEGFGVAFAANGQEALDVIDLGPLPDLVLLDWRMPGMGGEELLARLDKWAATAAIPVIVLTALTRVPSRGRPIVRKPIDLGELIFTVAEMCPPVWGSGDEPSTDRISSMPPVR